MSKQLVLFIRQAVRLNTPDDNGVSYRKHLETQRKQIEKVGKLSKEELDKRFIELEQVEIESGSERLLMMFEALSSTRGSTKAGPSAITHLEIKAYCDLMEEQLEPWEVETIRAMDRGFCEEAYTLLRDRMKKK